MPKHNASKASQTLSLMRKTEKIRKIRPEWAAGFATATVDGGKFSAIVAMKLAGARSEIRRFGITNDKPQMPKDPTEGYVWKENGKFFLAMQKGSFDNARKAIKGYLKYFGKSAPQFERAKPLPDDLLASLEAEDEEALSELTLGIDDEDDNDSDSDSDSGAAQSETGSTDAPSVPEAEDDDPIPQVPSAASAAAEVPLSQPEQDKARAAADQVSGTVRVVLARVLGDLPGMEALGTALQDRLMQRMSELPPEARSALLETAPSRLLMEATRAAVLGWTDRPDAPDALQTYPPEQPVNGVEVADHYIDLGTRVMVRSGSEQRVSRRLIEQRVTGFFDDAAEPQAKFAAIERLTKALLPALKDPERLNRMFGVTPIRGIEDLPPASVGLGAVRMALVTVLNQIEDCRAAHAAALEAEGSSMSSDGEAGFDAIADDLTTRCTDFIAAAEATIAKGPLSTAEADALTAQARSFYGEISASFSQMDSCAAAFAPTSAAQTYGQALARFAEDIQQAAAATAA